MKHTKLQDYEFKPDTQVQIRILKKDWKYDKLQTLPAMSISMTGHCLFITPVECERLDGKTVNWYTITHKYTGTTLCKHTKNITGLKQKARKFWRALPKEAKRLYQNPKIKDDLFEFMSNMRFATPTEAVQIMSTQVN